MYISGNRWVQKYADCAADRFRIDERLVKEILFVDETYLDKWWSELLAMDSLS
jgi:transposase-like protein